MQFVGTLEAPAGSTVVTPLTTLIQNVAASGNGDPVAAQQWVAAALGLHPGLDLNDLDTIAATRAGVTGAAEAFAIASGILNTVSLLEAAGATNDPFDVIAARLAVAAAGSIQSLSDPATVAALAASAGVPAAVANTVVQLVTASNALLDQVVASAGDPVSLLRAVTAVRIAAQGDTSHELTPWVTSAPPRWSAEQPNPLHFSGGGSNGGQKRHAPQPGGRDRICGGRVLNAPLS